MPTSPPLTFDAPSFNRGMQIALRREGLFAFLWMLEAHRLLGVDLTAVPGFQTPTVLVLLCELGPEFAAKFPSAKHFGSWLELCPDNRITGGKIYRVRTRDVKSRVAEALRLAAHLFRLLLEHFRVERLLVFEQVPENARQFMRHRRDGFGTAQARLPPPVEFPKVILRAP